MNLDQVPTEITIDHTGRKHTFPIYDANRALEEAIAGREARIQLEDATKPERECLWTDWNGSMRGRERG